MNCQFNYDELMATIKKLKNKIQLDFLVSTKTYCMHIALTRRVEFTFSLSLYISLEILFRK